MQKNNSGGKERHDCRQHGGAWKILSVLANKGTWYFFSHTRCRCKKPADVGKQMQFPRKTQKVDKFKQQWWLRKRDLQGIIVHWGFSEQPLMERFFTWNFSHQEPPGPTPVHRQPFRTFFFLPFPGQQTCKCHQTERDFGPLVMLLDAAHHGLKADTSQPLQQQIWTLTALGVT